MTFYEQAFESPVALAAFVNAAPVAQANITAIVRRDNIWVLFYWA